MGVKMKLEERSKYQQTKKGIETGMNIFSILNSYLLPLHRISPKLCKIRWEWKIQFLKIMNFQIFFFCNFIITVILNMINIMLCRLNHLYLIGVSLISQHESLTNYNIILTPKWAAWCNQQIKGLYLYFLILFRAHSWQNPSAWQMVASPVLPRFA